MASSRSFGNKRSLRPNILINNGIGAEVRDLRSDIELSFRSIESEVDLLSAGSGEVADIATLAALPGTSPSLVYTTNLRCYWRRDTSSTLTPDNITIVGAIGGGNWIRMVFTTSISWCAQAAWYLDPLLGNDENAGGALAPLATFSELNRRLSVGAIRQDVTVTIPAGANITAGAAVSVDRGQFVFSIVGTPTVIATGTVATYTDRTHDGAAPEAGLLTDAGVADWTPFVGMRIRITSGASLGAISYIARANPAGLGLNVARVVRFGGVPSSLGGVTATSPANNSTYVIESLPVLGGVSLRERGQLAVNAAASRAFLVSSVEVHSGTVGILSIDMAPYSRFVVDGCWLDCQCAFVGAAGYPARVVCRSRLGGPNLATFNLKGGAILRYVLVNPSSFLVSLIDESWQIDTAVFQSGTTGLLVSTVAGCLANSLFLRDSQFFNCDKAINFQNPGTIFCAGGLSGTGNNIGLLVGDADNEAQHGQLFCWSQATDLPNLLGTTTPIRIAGLTNIDLTWAGLPFASDRQNGLGTLNNGTATITARHASTLGVKVSKATPISGGGAQGTLTAPTASRTATQFVVNAVDGVGALVATDQSTFDWEVPGFARAVTLCQANALQKPI